MTQIVDRPHPQPLSLFGRGEKNVDRENLKIGRILYLKSVPPTYLKNGEKSLHRIPAR
ncbi:hypothetical protein [Hydrococcus rivularis]|uniref:hypothetical protein n=1 Tax=Hydrococcus rivularis TaxID=1616834 RepID=UPI000AC69A84|nr:hypothetical protein [Hydrococcus rivularis]